MVFDEICLNFANYDEISELLKVTEHVHDMPKNHYKLNLDHSNTNQKKWYKDTVLHCEGTFIKYESVASHFKFKNTVSIA